jgi:ParB family transcriptional regulator, chromosome partitioning protein
MAKSKGLGRGLAELISPQGAAETVQELAVNLIDPNPVQPRTEFDPQELAELAASIKAQGLLQPITVRPAGNGRFQLVAGERRLRATRDLGLTTIKAIVRDVDDRSLLELALVENLLRSDLNDIEVAEGLAELKRRHGYNDTQLADVLGRSRPAVSNTLRLLELPADVRELVRGGKLAAGHARTVLSFPEASRSSIAQLAAKERWSVRELERRAQVLGQPKAKPSTKPAVRPSSKQGTKRAEERLMEHLGTRVKIETKGASGTINISFHGDDDLERLLELLLAGASPF